MNLWLVVAPLSFNVCPNIANRGIGPASAPSRGQVNNKPESVGLLL